MAGQALARGRMRTWSVQGVDNRLENVDFLARNEIQDLF